MTASCPACGDTRLSFNRRPVRQYDEGDLFVCAGCGVNGESCELVDMPDAADACGSDKVEDMDTATTPKVTFKAWPHKLPLGVKAMYEVWLGDEKIGVVKHTKVEQRRQISQWNKQSSSIVRYTRRVRPLMWRADGFKARGPFLGWTRQGAVEALLEGIQEQQAAQAKRQAALAAYLAKKEAQA